MKPIERLPTELQASLNTSRERAHARRHTYNIEGEAVTMEQIGERLGGLHERTVRTRMAREKASPGPVTWAGLARGRA